MNETQAKEELEMFQKTTAMARSKGGESRRNVDRISGSVMSYDRPDILVQADNGRVIGIEHFRVDQYIGHGKKKESKSAEFSNTAESVRKQYETSALNNELSEEFYTEVGKLTSLQIKIRSNSCVDDIAESLEARLFGEEKRGHIAKLNSYKDNVDGNYGACKIELGFLIEFHTSLENWFLNNETVTRRIGNGEFPLSDKVYDLLKQASEKVDWLVLAFCSSYTSEVVDAAIIDCRNGKFKESMKRQKLFRTEYLGFGKESPYGKQSCQGKFEFAINSDSIDYKIENTSERINPIEICSNAIESTALAINLAGTGKPFAASFLVQLSYSMVKDSLTHKKKPITPSQVFNDIKRMSEKERKARASTFALRWNIKQP